MKTVLFVCLHGAAKSVVAAAEFERLARERGIEARAAFTGTEPVGGVVFLLVVAGLVFLIISGYNKLVGLRQRSDEAWSDIDVQLKRRTDLVPNLVETVKGYAAHERTTLDAVTRARGAAVAAQTPETRAQAENALTGALRQLMALAEAYPDLKANANFVQLQGALAGVYRTIPVRYERAGLEFALQLDGIGVYDEASRPLRQEIAYAGRYVRIKAWVPGATDTKKIVTFVYRVRRGLLRFEDHDELYWNATGDEWEVPIQHAEVYVNTPAGVSDKEVRTTAYTGPRGSAAQDFRTDRVGGYLRITATRPLRPREGMTVVVGWPPGYIGRPSPLTEARWLAGDTWPLALPLLAFGLGWLVWWGYGRDPARRSVKPEYEPPPGLIPAEAGALVDEKAEPREVLATIVDLAVRGYLHIEQITTVFGQPDFMFKRLKPIGGDPNLTDFELFVLAKLFSADWVLNMRLLSEVRRDYDHVFPPIRDRLYRLMAEDGLFPSSPSRMRRDWMVPGALLLVAAFVLPGYWPSWLDAYGLVLPIAIGASGLVLLGWSRAMAHRTWRGGTF